MPEGTLFPDTMKLYDDYTIREALHNCIAHQDYTLQQRINFVENPGYLYYSNAGTFIPGTLENALKNEEPQTHFRNECLCRAMVDFNMIDTVSRGIKKMFNEQWRRHFPMPDYEIDQIKKKVVVRIYGNEINKRYTDLLKTNDTLSLWDCISLDAVMFLLIFRYLQNIYWFIGGIGAYLRPLRSLFFICPALSSLANSLLALSSCAINCLLACRRATTALDTRRAASTSLWKW